MKRQNRTLAALAANFEVHDAGCAALCRARIGGIIRVSN